MLDFAAMSLSDVPVHWETLRRRLLAASEGDLAIGCSRMEVLDGRIVTRRSYLQGEDRR